MHFRPLVPLLEDQTIMSVNIIKLHDLNYIQLVLVLMNHNPLISKSWRICVIGYHIFSPVLYHSHWAHKIWCSDVIRFTIFPEYF